jgi:hypothetical protein
MATYTVKIVDHTKSDEFQKYKGGIKRIAQERFNEAFENTPETVTVSWGNGTEKDDLVMHFVQDVAHSLIMDKWPDSKIAPNAGGHTYRTAKISCSEIYEFLNSDSRQRQPVTLAGISIFHEALHNLLPGWGIEEMHNLDGGGEKAGLAAAKYNVNSKMTERNKELIRHGFAFKTRQYL